MVVAAVKALAERSCLIDGDVIACDANGLAGFQLLRRRRQHDPAMLCGSEHAVWI
jgi:ATP-dependent DNA ligase